MRRRTEFLVGIVSTVLATSLVTWIGLQWFVLRPARLQLQESRIATALEAAERIREGSPMEQVEREMGIDLRMDGGGPDGPPRPPFGEGPGPDGPGPEGPGFPGPPDLSWEQRTVDGQSVWFRRSGEHEIAAWSGERWVVLHDDALPLGWLLLGVIFFAGVPVVLVMDRLGRAAARPIDAAEASLGRIAGGELTHRLDEEVGSVELRRMAVAVNQMAERMERLVRGERERMAGLSHELRTPLTRVRLGLMLAKRTGGDTERLDRVERDIGELETLVDELLTLSQLEYGGSRALTREIVDLRGLVELLVDDEQHQDVAIEGEGEAWVDPRLVRRLVSNLLRNSQRHAPEAAHWVRIDGTTLVVGDDGPGVPDDQREHLFDVFWRGPEQRSVGYGLGLAIVHQIAVLHGAELTISAPPGFVATLHFPAPVTTRDN